MQRHYNNDAAHTGSIYVCKRGVHGSIAGPDDVFVPNSTKESVAADVDLSVDIHGHLKWRSQNCKTSAIADTVSQVMIFCA